MDYNKMFSEYEYFSVNVNEYVQGKDFTVTRPASHNEECSPGQYTGICNCLFQLFVHSHFPS